MDRERQHVRRCPSGRVSARRYGTPHLAGARIAAFLSTQLADSTLDLASECTAAIAT